MVTSYGYSTVIKMLLICMAISAAALIFPPVAQITFLLTAATALLFTLYFFRDPKRKTSDEKRIIVAPADGKLILVQKHSETVSGKPSTLVSIFMSPFNVHVNRIPLSGKVTHLRYHSGQFLMAFDPRSVESNEKMEIGISNGEIELRFSQVSGFLARRIVCQPHNPNGLSPSKPKKWRAKKLRISRPLLPPNSYLD